MKNIRPWKVLKSEFAFDHKWFKVKKDVVELPNGKVLDDYFYAYGGKVAIVFPITKDNEVVCVRQYKHAAKEILLELPAGFIDEKETSEDAARRELLEETGYSANDFIELASVYSDPTKGTREIKYFLAKDAEKVQEPSFDENEEIEVVLVPLDDMTQKIETGEIKVSDSIACTFAAMIRLGK